MSRFKPHFEILPPAQQTIWPQLAPTVELGLVLYGGTAVALRLGHRTSIDFDFFTDQPLEPDQLRKELPWLDRAIVIQSQPNTLSVLMPTLATTVKLSFFGSISIGRAGVAEKTEDEIVEVASLLDLLATKLKVIQQRIEAKDYQDIAAILRSGMKLEDGLAAASALYMPTFQPSEGIKALTYFEGGDLHQLSVSDREVLSRAVSSVRKVPIGSLTSRSLSSALSVDRP